MLLSGNLSHMAYGYFPQIPGTLSDWKNVLPRAAHLLQREGKVRWHCKNKLLWSTALYVHRNKSTKKSVWVFLFILELSTSLVLFKPSQKSPVEALVC